MNTVLADYQAFSESVILQSARNEFVGKLINIDFNDTPTFNSTVTLDPDIQSLHNLKVSIQALLQKADENATLMIDDHIPENDRIRDLKLELERLSTEESNLDNMIQERSNYLSTLSESISKVPKVSLKNYVNNEDSATSDSSILYLQDNISRTKQVIEALKYLHNIKSSEVSMTENNQLQLEVQYYDINVVFKLILGSDGRVQSIHADPILPSHMTSLYNTILTDSNQYPIPQDLKYCIYACHISSFAYIAIQSHIHALKQTCLIQWEMNTLHLSLTIASGMTAHIVLHYCYPEMPGGVWVEAMTPVNTFKATIQTEQIKNEINTLGFSNLLDLYHNYLYKI